MIYEPLLPETGKSHFANDLGQGKCGWDFARYKIVSSQINSGWNQVIGTSEFITMISCFVYISNCPGEDKQLPLKKTLCEMGKNVSRIFLQSYEIWFSLNTMKKNNQERK